MATSTSSNQEIVEAGEIRSDSNIGGRPADVAAADTAVEILDDESAHHELHLYDSMVAGGNVAVKYWYVEHSRAGAEPAAAAAAAGAAADEKAGSDGKATPAGRRGCRRRQFLFGRDAVYWALMVASTVALMVGMASAMLLGRFYFVHGGSGRWLYSFIECAGWPLLVPPLLFCYWKYSIRPTPLTPRLALLYFTMGCLAALENLLYSWGLSFLPVSTSSLLCSTQLIFTAVFAYALVRQKITSYILNSIVVITTGTVLLALSSDSDRPPNTTHTQYIIGVIVTIAASALFALLLPIIEFVYTNVVDRANFARVLEVEIGISVVSSILSLIGMWASHEVDQLVKQEAMAFDMGTAAYVQTLFWSAVGWQLYLVGGAGVIFLTSSLFSCCLMTALIPVLPLLAVVFFHDSFSAVKGIAMVLSLWGFISYTYGCYVETRTRPTRDQDAP